MARPGVAFLLGKPACSIFSMNSFFVEASAASPAIDLSAESVANMKELMADSTHLDTVQPRNWQVQISERVQCVQVQGDLRCPCLFARLVCLLQGHGARPSEASEIRLKKENVRMCEEVSMSIS